MYNQQNHGGITALLFSALIAITMHHSYLTIILIISGYQIHMYISLSFLHLVFYRLEYSISLDLTSFRQAHLFDLVNHLSSVI